MALAEHGGLFVPSSVVDELVEERAAAMAREVLERQPIPMLPKGATGAHLGEQPRKEKLLRELTGWGAIAARAIVRRLTTVRFYVGRLEPSPSGKLEVVRDPRHPLNLTLRRPAPPTFSWRLVATLLGYHYVQAGEGYLQKLRDGSGLTRELWPLHTQYVEPLFGGDDVISAYRVHSPAGSTTDLPPEDVVRVWDPDPLTLYTAMGVLGPQAVEYDAQRYLQEHLRNHFGDDATPRVVLEAQPEAKAPTPQQEKKWQDRWRQRFHDRWGSSTGVPAIGPSGFTFKELSAHGGVTEVSPLNAAYRDQLLMAYGVPRSVVGDVVDANRAAAETNQYVMDVHTVEPIAEAIAESLTTQVAMDFDPNLVVAYEPFAVRDKDFELRREGQDLDKKVRSVHQVLEARGEDPAQAPWGALPVGTLADEPYDGTPDDGRERASDLRDREHPELRTRRERTASRGARAYFDPEASWQRVIVTERQWIRRFQRAYLSVFETQRRDILRKLRASQRFASSGGQVRAELPTVEQIFDPRQWPELFRVRVEEPQRQPLFRQEANQTSQALVDEDFTFTPTVATLLETRGAEAVVRINATTQRKLAEILSRGTKAGASVDTIAREINGLMRNRKRSRTIARTEILKTSQMAQEQSFAQSGVVIGKTWNSSRDDRVRDSHMIDGQTVALRDSFTLGDGERAAYPGDPNLSAGNVINCRCFQTPVLAGEEETIP